MNKYEHKRKEKVDEIIATVKLLSIFFCSIIVIIFFNVFPIVELLGFKSSTASNLSIVTLSIICIVVLVLSYQVWIFSTKKDVASSKTKARGILEIIAFILFFSFLIIISGAHESQYKFIYLFIIITSTIQFGMKSGLVVSSVSSAIVLIMDLILQPFDSVNRYFETDIILSGIFILTAWLLGYYVKIEEDYREKLVGIANIDELTGLYNHRYFQEALNNQLETCKELNTPCSLLFVDIDYFKYYNDLNGHLAGDDVLKKIGAILKDNLRREDIVARYGGEEFAVILPGVGERQAVEVGERIRNSIEQASFEGEENQPNGKLTVSVGISCYPEKSKTKMELISSADDALYRAKFFSKNRVETYYSVLEELKTDIEKEHIDLISSIKTLISVINAKDHYTYAHTERVVGYCQQLAKELKLSEEDSKILKYGAYLHDIGKIEVSKEILNKRSPLTEEEWDILKKHPANGVNIIKTVDSLKKVIPLILYHHEKYDGSGYPEQLKGNRIPYLARVLTLADSFDAMTSNRPYKAAKTFGEAILELRNCKYSHFDPDIVDAFIKMLKREKLVFK